VKPKPSLEAPPVTIGMGSGGGDTPVKEIPMSTPCSECKTPMLVGPAATLANDYSVCANCLTVMTFGWVKTPVNKPNEPYVEPELGELECTLCAKAAVGVAHDFFFDEARTPIDYPLCADCLAAVALHRLTPEQYRKLRDALGETSADMSFNLHDYDADGNALQPAC